MFCILHYAKGITPQAIHPPSADFTLRSKISPIPKEWISPPQAISLGAKRP
ncbi:MAG: hypothetical protein GX802_02815 [Clostridiales bacterium]|nr:hypothetical protein [Clostridiales bacterium]